MALPVSIFALVVTGAMISGAFFIGTQEQRVAENVALSEHAFAVAEGAANEEFRVWKPEEHNARQFYPRDPLALHSDSAEGTVYKLNRNLYLLDATATAFQNVRGRGARRRVLLLGRIRPLGVPMDASLTTRGAVRLSGNAAVDGTDQTPNTSWASCSAPDSTRAGVRAPDTVAVTAVGNARISGSPSEKADPTVKDSTFTNFGDVTYGDLAPRGPPDRRRSRRRNW